MSHVRFTVVASYEQIGDATRRDFRARGHVRGDWWVQSTEELWRRTATSTQLGRAEGQVRLGRGTPGGRALTWGIAGRGCHGWQRGQILQLRADAQVMSECSDREEAAPVVSA